MRARLLHGIVVAVALLLASCGGSPQGPTPPPPPPAQQAPTVASIAPNTGLAEGGNSLTITGTNFAAGAAVTIGGVAAPGVTVQSATTISAAAPPHAAGAVDVVVTVNGLSGTLSGGYTYTAPPAANAPPVITSLVAQDRRPGTPRNFADLEDLVDVTATVQDAETPVDQLIYEWSAEAAAAFEGSGRSVRWRAPDRYQTPANIVLRLTVIERFQGGENRVSSTVTIALHDSEKEIVDLGYQFLVEFSEQKLSPDAIVRNFTDSCRGKQDELGDVIKNQRDEVILEWSVDPRPQVTVAFDAVCPYYAPERIRPGDGCAWFPTRWKSLIGGKTVDTRGFDQVNAVFEDGRWRLCDSDWKPTSTTENGVASTRRIRK